MRSQIFGGSPGDRRGVSNVAVILTDGKSTIDESQTIPAAGISFVSVIIVYKLLAVKILRSIY